MRARRQHRTARGPACGAFAALPLSLVVLCGFAGAGERVSVPCRILDSQPLFSKALERGVKESATLRALLAALDADERVTLYFTLGDLSPGLRARSCIRIRRHRDCRGDCLLNLKAEIRVRWRASPNRRIAAAAHELVHLLRLLNGSSDEGRGSRGEIIADRIERRVYDELSRPGSSQAWALWNRFEREKLFRELLAALPVQRTGNSVRVEPVRYERLVPPGRGAGRTGRRAAP